MASGEGSGPLSARASLRVLQITTDTDRRGAQVFATDLHRALVSAGWTVRTVALAPGAVGGLDLPVLGARRLGPATLRALHREAREASVLVAHGSSTLPACALVSAACRTPFVYRQVSDSLFWAPTNARRIRVRAGLSRAARIVALWSGAAHTLESHFGVPSERIRVVANGVPVDRFPLRDTAVRAERRLSLGLQEHRPTALYIGALAPEKGVDVAIEALRKASELQLLVVGDGPDAARLREKAERDAPGRVVFVGPVSNPLRCYEAADVVVLPSRGGDSMPAVLIEAGLVGLPVVATRIEGIPEIVVDGVTGVLVPVESDRETAHALLRMVGDEGRMFGEAARAHCVTRFSIDVIAGQWTSVIEEAAAIGKRRS